jgi:hypothetical protein
MATKGSQICKESADQIREVVERELAHGGHVDREFIGTLRTSARKDAELHRDFDPSFNLGSGPAVERH